jgi:hypothetical protein
LPTFSDYDIELVAQNVCHLAFSDNQKKVKIQLDKSLVAHLILALEMTIAHRMKTVAT